MRAQEQALVNESFVLPDEVKHVKEQLEKTSRNLKRFIFLCAIISTVLFGLALYFIVKHVVDSEGETLKIANDQLANENEQLVSSNTKMQKNIQTLEDNMVALHANISKFNNQITATNQQIVDLQTYLQQNCDVIHQKLRLNDTNLNVFVIAVPGSAHSKQLIPSITDLDLSMNKLTSFCENALPDLHTIDLSNNPIANISNNRLNSLESFKLNNNPTLEQFNGNNLPLLTKLDLNNNHLTSFKDNYFPEIQTIQLYRNYLTEISNYSLFSLSSLQILGNPIKILKNNRFPVLTELMCIDGVNLNTVIGNYFGGLQRFVISCGNQILTFQANTIPKLKDLVLESCIYDYAKIKTNDFQILSSLVIKDSRLNNFQYLSQLSQIKEFSLSSTNVTSFSRHNYPNMTCLYLLDNTQLTLFENNTLPRLEDLFISGSAKLQSLCKSDMPSLKTVQASDLGLTDLACFNNYKSLQQIDVFTHNITNITDFNLPKLTNLVLSNGVVQAFKNNSLPSLKHLEMQVNSPEIDMSSFKNALEILNLQGPLASFSNYNLPSLQKLTLEPRNDIDFKQNNLPKLTQLYLKKISMSKLGQNIFGPIQRMELEACLSQCTLFSTYDNSLEYLTIASSNFISFVSRDLPNLSSLAIVNSALQSFIINKLPKIKQIDLSSNNLASFDCYGISTVQVLNLSDNKLTDDIATTLLSCTFTSLKYLDLQRNPNILHPGQVRSRLSAYLNATIII